MITKSLILSASKGNVKAVKEIYELVKRNEDNTDKIECFRKHVNTKIEKNIEYDDILYLFDKYLWKAILKWSNKKDITDENEIHNIFIGYVWISIRNSYLTEYVYKICGNKKHESADKIAFVKAMNNSLSFQTDNINETEILSYVNEYIDRQFEYLQRLEKIIEIFPEKRKRWKKIIRMTLRGFNMKEMAAKLNVNVVTIRKDVYKITWLFDNINLANN